MLYKYFTEKLLGLQDVDIEKVEEIDNSIHINCRLKRKPHKCPCCGKLTDKVQDYREQPIKDIPAFGKHIFIHLNKRRYCCSCGKRFRNRILHMFSHQMQKSDSLIYYRLFISILLFGFTPTIDIEPYYSNLHTFSSSKAFT